MAEQPSWAHVLDQPSPELEEEYRELGKRFAAKMREMYPDGDFAIRRVEPSHRRLSRRQRKAWKRAMKKFREGYTGGP